MTSLRPLLAPLSRWIDLVAATLVELVEQLSRRRAVRLVELEPGVFVAEDGGRPPPRLAETDLMGAPPLALRTLASRKTVALVLHPSRFLFRPLELPRQAADFLDGIVRSQIDRLTPWSVSEAAFGWSPPAPQGAERIVVTVAATDRSRITAVVETLAAAGARAVTVFASPPDPAADGPAVRVLEHRARGGFDHGRARRVLIGGLAGAAAAAAVGIGAGATASVVLGARQDELAREVSRRRAVLMTRQSPATDPATLARRSLERRKHETQPTVLVLEAVSRLLPDHSYVTEFRIEGNVLRLTGFTRDAPGLIRAIEQSSEFARASFFAPTTRGPSDPGERFHIEATIQPRQGPPS
ncbi:hypothetical protein RHODGE_RHODGE_04106 [Rhodoplanes serenus]|uniref:Pilus assembly protein PilN n=1 Tax=Rhodoplanes serenus TaxID=200615 RepID=A0A447CYX0_9BRAD|nr:PilN domain-containing protein [Rhodoplanes serenus]VCU10507.1 hypothetical protein RHODGE_RHODGE_04106 [Rhodoplanes serenus]